MSLKIAADRDLQNLDQLIPKEVDLHRFDSAGGLPPDIATYDALLIRTVTRINRETLPETGSLKFIGTATAGTDHVDGEYLAEMNVEFAQSEGCNANAVAEYIITVLYYWAQKTGVDLGKKRIGVAGCGHTGGAVIELLRRLDLNYVAYDPPKQERDPGFRSASEEELLQSDILTLHTPLTTAGPYATRHLCGRDWLQHGFDLVINAARGGILDESALLELHRAGTVNNYILDVWKNEPYFSGHVAKSALIATPHIAGYSKESKFRATKIVLTRLLHFFGFKPNPPADPEPFSASEFKADPSFTFSDIMWQNNQVHLYDTELRKLIGLPAKQKGDRFARLRSKTSLRHEYRAMLDAITPTDAIPDKFWIFR